MKVTMEDMHDRLENWKKDDVIDDFVIAHDSGYTEICIYLAQGFGCLDESNEVEKAILDHKVPLETFQKLCDECFKGVIVMENENTNETWWIPNMKDQGIDYFVSEQDCIEMGYTSKHSFGN